MKKIVFFLCLSVLIGGLLSSCGGFRISSINQRDDIGLKRAELGYSYDTLGFNNAKSAAVNYNKSLDLAYAQIAKGEVKTDGQGLLVIIDNESGRSVNTIVVGPIPTIGVIDLGAVPPSTALALSRNNQYNHRSYYIEAARHGLASYDEDYLPPGKYVALSLYRGQTLGQGWCFEVSAQMHTYKKMKVHGYTVIQ